MWRVWGDRYTTTTIANTAIYQKCTFARDFALVAARVWLIFYNNPTFTSLNMKIYAERNAAPGKLLHTSSNSPLKTEILTLANGIKEIYFEFNPGGGVPLKADAAFYFVINGTGVGTFDETSHISWKKGWPDPAYRLGGGIGANDLAISKYDIAFVGANL